MYKTWRYVPCVWRYNRSADIGSDARNSPKEKERTEVLPENEPCNSGAGKRQLTVLLRYVRLLINIVCLYSSRQLVVLTFQQLLLKHLHLLENNCASTCFGRNSGQYAHFLTVTIFNIT